MGVVLLDTSVVIAVLNRGDSLHSSARNAVLAERARHTLAISVLTYGEMLVGPLHKGAEALDIAERFAAQTSILDVSPPIARVAAELRVRSNLKLPDAVILATGLRHGVDVILTGDARWREVAETVRVIGRDPTD